MSKIEIWKDIPNYEGYYQVSSLGRVKSLNYNRTRKPRVLKQGLDGYGYPKSCISKDGKAKNIRVHRLVMLAFKGKSELQVNHINGIKTDNRLENLEYCTQSENINHAVSNGLILNGENHGKAKLTRACAERIKYGHQGMTQKEVANLYGISRQQVSDIRLNNQWKHI